MKKEIGVFNDSDGDGSSSEMDRVNSDADLFALGFKNKKNQQNK